MAYRRASLEESGGAEQMPQPSIEITTSCVEVKLTQGVLGDSKRYKRRIRSEITEKVD